MTQTEQPEIEQPETECPECGKMGQVSEEPEGGVDFTDKPRCILCKFKVLDELRMDDFDRAYERERANGWAD